MGEVEGIWQWHGFPLIVSDFRSQSITYQKKEVKVLQRFSIP